MINTPRLNRRSFGIMATTISSIAFARRLLGVPKTAHGQLGICTFSCHRHWEAVRTKEASAKFSNAMTFIEYAISIGADGVQTQLGDSSNEDLSQLRSRVDRGELYFEGDVRLPNSESDVARFTKDIERLKRAGATKARTFFSGSRRYETWKSRAEFLDFRRQSELRLSWALPVVEKHEFQLAIENHKDFKSDELAEILDDFHSEYLGVNLDTGNNLALLEDPYETVERLAPYALTVHLKDMAVKRHQDGFLLSEVPCGQGALDLKRIAAKLLEHRPDIRFNLEMATRDPLIVPCHTDLYWQSFESRDEKKLEAMQEFVKSHVPLHPVPSIAGKPIAQQIIDEETNNVVSLDWMHKNL